MGASQSFRERLAWVSLSTYLVVFGAYFWAVAENWSERGAGGDYAAMASLMALGALVLVFLAMKLGERLEAPRKQAMADERERLVELKAARVAGIVTTTAAAAAAVGALAFGLSAFLTAHLLIVALVLAQAAKAIAQIVYFKVGV